MGEQGKDYSQKKIENLSRIFASAQKYLGPKLEEEQSGIPPRVLKEIIENGSFCEDEVCTEYYGGILASSRSGISRDDRAIVMLDIIKSLSTYQIRTHYVVYQILRTIFLDTSLNVCTDSSDFTIYIPVEIYEEAISLEEGEILSSIVTHSIVGLVNKGLLAQDYQFGSKEFLRSRYPKHKKIITSEGLILTPTVIGAQLFIWANGFSNKTEDSFINGSLNIKPHKGVSIPSGTVPLKNSDHTNQEC